MYFKIPKLVVTLLMQQYEIESNTRSDWFGKVESISYSFTVLKLKTPSSAVSDSSVFTVPPRMPVDPTSWPCCVFTGI